MSCSASKTVTRSYPCPGSPWPGDLEPAAVRDPGLAGASVGGVDRVRMRVEADEARRRIGLRHDDRRGAVAAADVGDARAGPQPRLHAVEGRDPRLDQVAEIRRAEEPLDAVEERVVVLVPADALAGAERLGELVDDPAGGDRGLERADEERRAVLVGERHRLLGRQRVQARFGVVGDVARRGLRVQPLADVALGGPGLRGKTRGRERANGRQRAEQAQTVADHDERSDVGAAEVDDGAADELIELLFVDDGRGGGFGGGGQCGMHVDDLQGCSHRQCAGTIDTGTLPRGAPSCPIGRAARSLARAAATLARSARTLRPETMDALSELLRAVKLSGAMFFIAECSKPWRVHLAASGDPRPLRGARRQPRDRVPPDHGWVRLHPGGGGTHAVRRRRPPDGAARRRARDGQWHGRGALRRRAGRRRTVERRSVPVADRRRWRGDAHRLRLPGVRRRIDQAGGRRAAARGARASAQRSGRRVAREHPSTTPSCGCRRPRPAATSSSRASPRSSSPRRCSVT